MAESIMNPAECPVYPIPQEIALSGQDLPLDRAVIVVPGTAGAQEQFAARLLRDWIADEWMVNLPIVEQEPPAEAPAITITTRKAAKKLGGRRLGVETVSHPEGYSLNVAPDFALAVGRDSRGMLYAVATMMHLIVRREGKLFLRGAAIRDWPFLPIRHVHVYVPGKDDVPFFKRYIRDGLLRHKYNGMVMEMGGGVRLRKHPEIATAWRRIVKELYAYGDRSPTAGEACPLGPGRRFQDATHAGVGGGAYLEPEDLRGLVEFARAHGQEVVPEVQSLSHVYYLASARRDIAERPESLFPDAYCPSNEESYKLLFEVLDEYVELMQARTVHIGHDEWRTAGDCPQCKERPAADLYARDIIRIYQHLRAQGVGVWMWGDHFYSGHCETGRSLGGQGGPVWYLTPDTQGAWKQVLEACPEIVLCNWSWPMRDERGKQGAGDAELRQKGFRFLYGNFHGSQVEDWPGRAKKFQALGAEVSSWCRADEFQLGKMHVAQAIYSANMLWSSHYPPADQAAARVMQLLPGVRDRLRGDFDPDIRLTEPAQATLDLSGAFNSPLKTQAFDLSGLRMGLFREGGLDVQFGQGAAVVRRTFQPESAGAAQVTIAIDRPLAKLVFWQSSFGQARRTLHVGDGTAFPRESSEAIGLYDVAFADGLIVGVPIRYDENVSAWDSGLKGMLYHGRPIIAGTLPGGGPLVIWGNEWANPRPDVPIALVRFRGTGRSWDDSRAQPILLGITGVQKVRLEDYRGKLPY